MKTKCLLLLFFIFNAYSYISAQSDADIYWIKENFSQFDASGGWVIEETDYETYPNNIALTTTYANVEASEYCAKQNDSEGNMLRIRGLKEGGAATFTVPNASKVKIHVTGKSDLQDRTVLIYRNGELVKTYEYVDRTICYTFTDNINSQEPVTYRITAGNELSTDPVVVYSIEVLKYGMDEPNTDAEDFWIKEDFSQFDADGSWIIEETNYESYPNNIKLTTTYANVEISDDCAKQNNANANMMRIRGLKENGSIKFTVPNAGKVTIHVTGKSSAQDRTVRIYRNEELIKTYENLDKNVCRAFVDEVYTQSSVTYRITAGDEESTSPIAVYYVEVEKYTEKPDPGTEYDGYWIYEDFSQFQLESDYLHGTYEMFPNDIVLRTDSANIELGDGCTSGNNILRLRGSMYVGGAAEFTVPNAGKVTIKLTGKSTAKDREISIYKDGNLMQHFTGLDRNECVEFIDETNSNTDVDITYRIIGGNNTEKPAAITGIYVEKSGYSSIEHIDNNIQINIYPNPASEVVYLKTYNEKPVTKAIVFDMAGRQVLMAEKIVKLNINNLNKGTYILKIITEDGTVSKKLIKN